MAVITYPLNGIEYDASGAELFHCTRRSGVFMGSSGDKDYSDFDAAVTGSDRVVTIQPGLAWIRNGQFKGKVVAVTSSTSLTLPTSNSSYPRYDAIVLRFNVSANSSSIMIVQGTASASPSRPTPVRAEGGSYDLHLYHVYRPAGSSVITSSNVEDMRGDLNYCGYMVDDVSAFDEGKFLSKEDYDPSDSVAKAGGIASYVSNNKVTVSSSLTSTSTTTAASSSAVKKAYDLAQSTMLAQRSGSVYVGNEVVGTWKTVGNDMFLIFTIDCAFSNVTNPVYLTLGEVLPPLDFDLTSVAFMTYDGYKRTGVLYRTSQTNATLYFSEADGIDGTVHGYGIFVPD